jgi:hypothetical protein
MPALLGFADIILTSSGGALDPPSSSTDCSIHQTKKPQIQKESAAFGLPTMFA